MSDTVINEARWDENVRQWSATGGPSYSTQIVSVQSGDEQRAANWIQPRGTYNLGDRDVPSAKYQKLLSFFHRMRGRFHGFRIRDWTDYADDERGVLGGGVGNGAMSYQMNKVRGVDGVSGVTLQKITRPVGPTFASNPDLGNTIRIYKDGMEVPQVNAPGGCLVDDTKGTVLFIPHSFAISSIAGSPGASVITFSGAHNFSVGEFVTVAGYVDGLDGNNGSWQISNIPNSNSVEVFATLTSTSEGGATGSDLPGVNNTLTWTGLYDIPARFDTDSFNMNQIQAFIEGGEEQRPSDVWIRLGSIPVIQLRE